MVNVLFVCHGNICRSPMAEYLFKEYVKKEGVADSFYIQSAATSSEELGNPVYPPVKRILNGRGIDCSEKTARRIVFSDYEYFDYIIGMDQMNVVNLTRFFGGDVKHKIYKLLDFDNESGKDISDPWYSGDFVKAEDDISRGIIAFYVFLKKHDKIV